MGMVRLVVSETVTSAREYAPGPCLLSLEIREGVVEATVWDSSAPLRSILAADSDCHTTEHRSERHHQSSTAPGPQLPSEGTLHRHRTR